MADQLILNFDADINAPKYRRRVGKLGLLVPGQRFGKLTLLGEVPNVRLKRWFCVCDCGKLHQANDVDLKKGHIQSCGRHGTAQESARKKAAAVAKIRLFEGERFGRLLCLETLVSERIVGEKIKTSVRCLCDCGNEAIVPAQSFRGSAPTQSCGCLQKEAFRKIGAEYTRSQKVKKGQDPEKRLTPENQKGRMKNAKIMQHVKWMDNFTCFICQKRGGVELHVHHVIPWAHSPEKRNDVNNLMTLCRECHIVKVHDNKIRAEPASIGEIENMANRVFEPQTWRRA